MLQKKMRDLLNTQITKELESAYLYLGFANYFREEGLEGFAHWYDVQVKEEVAHAERFLQYIHDCGGIVTLNPIASLYEEPSDDLALLQSGLAHERIISSLIDTLYSEATDMRDYRTMQFLEWFLAEQTEEEANAQALIDKYTNFVCECGCGLYELDRELRGREE